LEEEGLVTDNAAVGDRNSGSLSDEKQVLVVLVVTLFVVSNVRDDSLCLKNLSLLNMFSFSSLFSHVMNPPHCCSNHSSILPSFTTSRPSGLPSNSKSVIPETMDILFVRAEDRNVSVGVVDSKDFDEDGG
jgi:hypothetical protein